MAGQVVVAGTDAVEREYLAHRSEVLAMLRASFAGVSDLEELYQEAWTEVLELRASGQTVSDIGALLRTIAWRRGRDRLRKNQPSSLDPSSPAMLAQTDGEAAPDEAVQVGLDAKLIWQVVDSLEPREAAVIKLRFERQMNSREIQRELGVTPRRLEKIVTRAYSQVEQALTSEDGAESQWRKHQRSLLVACESGLASASQRRQAKRMVKDDPVCRAMLAEIRRTLHSVAALTPLPLVAAGQGHSRLAHIWSDLTDRLDGLRGQVAEWVSRLLPHGSSVEQAGAGSAASVGGGFALKAALTCVALTGTTVVCITSVTPDKPKPATAQSKPKAAKPAKPVVIEPQVAMAEVTPPVKIKRRAAASQTSNTTTSATAPPPPSPAPSGSTEFGPGNVGSTAASSTPAAAPAGGSGEFTP